MPLYIINYADEVGHGPFQTKVEASASVEDDSTVEAVVVEIDENGVVTLVQDAAEFFENEQSE